MTIFQIFGSRLLHWTLTAPGADLSIPIIGYKAVAPVLTARNRIDPMSA